MAAELAVRLNEREFGAPLLAGAAVMTSAEEAWAEFKGAFAALEREGKAVPYFIAERLGLDTENAHCLETVRGCVKQLDEEKGFGKIYKKVYKIEARVWAKFKTAIAELEPQGKALPYFIVQSMGLDTGNHENFDLVKKFLRYYKKELAEREREANVNDAAEPDPDLAPPMNVEESPTNVEVGPRPVAVARANDDDDDDDDGAGDAEIVTAAMIQRAQARLDAMGSVGWKAIARVVAVSPTGDVVARDVADVERILREERVRVGEPRVATPPSSAPAAEDVIAKTIEARVTEMQTEMEAKLTAAVDARVKEKVKEFEANLKSELDAEKEKAKEKAKEPSREPSPPPLRERREQPSKKRSAEKAPTRAGDGKRRREEENDAPREVDRPKRVASRATPLARKYAPRKNAARTDYFPVGTKIRKMFDGEWFKGVVREVDDKDQKLPYFVKYEDGDKEDLSHEELSRLVVSPRGRPRSKLIHYDDDGEDETTSDEDSEEWEPTAAQLERLNELFKAGVQNPSERAIARIANQLSTFGKCTDDNVERWFAVKRGA